MYKTFKVILVFAVVALIAILSGCDNDNIKSNVEKDKNSNINSNNIDLDSNLSENQVVNDSKVENIIESNSTKPDNTNSIDNNSVPDTNSELVSHIPIKDIDDEPMDNPTYETNKSYPISTDNSDFNSFFTNNGIDVKYQQELKYCDTTRDMISKTAEYTQEWYNEVFDAFDKLSELLEGQDNKIQVLNAGLEEWSNSIPEVINRYDQEARDSGGSTINILEAENKKMLFYRSQACEYYKQVYELIGEFDLSIA